MTKELIEQYANIDYPDNQEMNKYIKNCEWCGKEFKSNKYAKVRFCSRHCSSCGGHRGC